MVTNIEKLREICLTDLTEEVQRGFNYRYCHETEEFIETPKIKPKVRYPAQWKKLASPEQDSLLGPDDIAKTWVWSDLHFGHKNIIRFSDRPFASLDAMTAELIDNFNMCVGPNDKSIWVGDVAFLKDSKANEILDQCNGYKILVVGNHDFNHKKLKQLNFDETYLFYLVETPEVDLMFTHYPIMRYLLPWPYINIHGHVHVGGDYKFESDQHINVNCEFHDYLPVQLEWLIKQAHQRVISHGI